MKLEFIFMAAVSALLGIILTFIVIFVCMALGIDMGENLWVIVIPVILAITLNIFLIELYRKYKKNKLFLKINLISSIESPSVISWYSRNRLFRRYSVVLK